MTWWLNPLEHAIVLRLADAGEEFDYRVQSGEAFEVPSKFDVALQEVRDGIVVGGMARYLKRLDGKPEPTAKPEDPAPIAVADAPPDPKPPRRK